MSKTEGSDESPASDLDYDEAEVDPDVLRGQIEVLEAQRRQLQADNARLRQVSYRRTAVGLAIIGMAALGGSILFPDARALLIALAATGFFGAVLTVWLTPERFVRADVGESVFTALASSLEDAITELGLQEKPHYVPTENGVRMLLTADGDVESPAGDLDRFFVLDETGDNHGIALEPTGQPLVDELGDNSQDAPTVQASATMLADGLVEVLEVAHGVDVDVDPVSGRATFEIADPLYGPLTRIDHPIVSTLAVGIAETVDAPTTTDVTTGESPTVSIRWDAQQAESAVD